MGSEPGAGNFRIARRSPLAASLTTAERSAEGIIDEPRVEGHQVVAHASPLDPLDAALSAMEALTRIPLEGEKILLELQRLSRIIDRSFGADVWANAADISNVTPSAFGATQFTTPCFANLTRTAATALKNIFVGASGAAVVQLVKAFGGDGQTLLAAPAQNFMVVGTVRITANNLAAWFPGVIILRPGEQLHLIASANVSLDFSCDWRVLRGE